MSKIIAPDRVKHVQGVAEYMYQEAEKYQLDPDRMYLLGILQDIGALHEKKENGEAGAALTEKYGYADSELIRQKDCSLSDYTRKHNCSRDEIPKELVLLWEAELRVGKNGNVVRMKERLTEMAKEHGKKSRYYANFAEKAEWMEKSGQASAATENRSDGKLFAYREFRGIFYPSLENFFRDTPGEKQEELIRYLKEGGKVVRVMEGPVYDYFSGEFACDNMEIRDDGVYNWNSVLAYYVEKYNMELPEDFQEHAAKAQL